ncbi:MAG: SDR family oxidoreductase [Syntrophobacteraceae bacterium]
MHSGTQPIKPGPILVLGATGYVGGRLVPRLLEAGYRVRVMGRSAAKLESRPWACRPGLEVAQGDMLDPPSLERAVSGCRAAYYLVHPTGEHDSGFEETERRAAMNMAAASEGSSLDRIIYLGTLGEDRAKPSGDYAQSRCAVADILLSGPVPLTYLRAATILGSGSASFEIMRYLTDRQPVAFAPPWMQTPIQPISIRNVLFYLVGCLERDETVGETFDIGGPEVLTFRQLIEIYAEVARLKKRILISAPFISTRLSAVWIHLLTPVPAPVARPLVESLVHGAVCRDNRIRAILPQDLLDCRETVRRAIEKVEQQLVEGCWSDAGPLRPPEWTHCGDEDFAGGSIMKCGYKIRLHASPEEVWEPIVRIGGRNGWYYGESLWIIRGWLDKIFGGTSLRRGRRHPTTLYVGDALDFWRVLDVSAPNHLLLLSEMKMPGEAMLEFRITPVGKGQTELSQLSRFLPRGTLGLLYWYSLYGAHQWIFKGMLRTIARATGKPLLKGPVRFTPKLPGTCVIEPHG